MPVEGPSSARAAAEDQRESARQAAAQYFAQRADMRRDTRIEEAKASEPMRPAVAGRLAQEREPNKRSPSNAKVLDILA